MKPITHLLEDTSSGNGGGDTDHTEKDCWRYTLPMPRDMAKQVMTFVALVLPEITTGGTTISAADAKKYGRPHLANIEVTQPSAESLPGWAVEAAAFLRHAGTVVQKMLHPTPVLRVAAVPQQSTFATVIAN